MWEFVEVRALAIKTLTSMEIEGIERLRLAKTYNVKHWWLPALRAAATQRGVTEEDIEIIGGSLCLKVATLQGQVSARNHYYPPYLDRYCLVGEHQRRLTPFAPFSEVSFSVGEGTVINRAIRELFPEIKLT